MERYMQYVRKRDGTVAEFAGAKITDAIFKAAQAVGGTDRKLAETLAGKAINIDEFANGVSNRYLTNKDETVFVINIFPRSTDASLKFFKQFGEEIADHVNKFDFKKFAPTSRNYCFR